MGRGVTDQVAALCMLYHQKSLAHVNAGSRRWAASQTFSPATRRFDCRQSQTSDDVAEVPAVGDRAVVSRQEPGDERGLRGAGDCRQDRAERTGGALAGEGGEARGRLADELPGQADDEEDDRPVHDVRSRPRRRRRRRAGRGQGPGGPVRSAAPVTRGAWPRRTEFPSNSRL